MSEALDGIAARLRAGERLDDGDEETLLASHDLISIGMLADELRHRHHGRRATFVRVAEIRAGDTPPAGGPLPGAAREVRIAGRPAGVAAAVEAVRAAVAFAGGIPLTGFSLADLLPVAARDGISLPDLARELRDAGLQAVAAVPVDLAGAARAIDDARAGGLRVLRLIVPRVDAGSRLDSLRGAESLQRTVGGLRAFAPLPATLDPAAPTTGYDDVKQVALARLLVDNIESIQVDWRLYGPKLAQVALTVGADDLDGVTAVDTSELGVRRAPAEEIHRNIRAASLDAVERDGLFAVVDA